MELKDIQLTKFSHGAGCGCKISPAVLDKILESSIARPDNAKLLVGNDSRDDAAVYDMGGGMALISTTDFFMPIVDDPFDFGRIASANAISDVYAMGGKPFLAIAILGWPVDKLPATIAGKVVEGARQLCLDAGVSLAGGHSIDSPEPIFGLAVNGLVAIKNIKKNAGAKIGDLLYLTKPIGTGILTTAEKREILKEEHRRLAPENMLKLNVCGQTFGELDYVHAMTDVTGFGLLGHLCEMCQGSGLSARIHFSRVPILTDLSWYLKEKSVPGGTNRNYDSYGKKIGHLSEDQKNILCDPQTSGGLLVSIDPSRKSDFEKVLHTAGLSAHTESIGEIRAQRTDGLSVEVV